MRPELSSYRHLAAGKVRELYEIDGETLLMVATDRISAYDHILRTPIPDKGRVLTAMSAFFFDALDVPNHLAGPLDDERIPAEVLGRAMVVRRLDMVQAECVARGYLTGSGMVEYRESQAVCGIDLPAGLVEASRLPEPIFTPATKAAVGDHDENISFDQLTGIVGAELAERLRTATLDVYERAAQIAADRGVLLADTKFEFGLSGGELILADEVLTPDSSRYWPADGYAPGHVQPSFDKQFVRDWLTGPDSGWDKASDSPPPPLPPEVVDATRARYIEAYERISGLRFADWLGGEVGTSADQTTTPTPPVAERRPHRREHHGRVFVDDYEWMRDKDAPATREYLEAENAYTDAMTSGLKPLEDEVYEEIRSRVKETDMSVPVRSGGWWYFSRTSEGQSYARHCRVPVPPAFVADPADPAGWVPPEVSPGVDLPGEQLLLDGNAEAEGHEYFALGAFSVSHDGRVLAWATDTEGDERYTLRFRSLDPEVTAPDEEIAGIAAGVTWSRDGHFVFYVTVDDAWRPDTVWRHRLGTTRDDDDKVFHEPDESYWIGVGETRSEKYLQIAVGSKITTEVWCLDSADPAGEFWCVRPREEGVEYDVEHAVVGGEDRFVITHNAGSPNSAVVEGPVGPVDVDFRELHTLVPHRDDVRVEGVDAFARMLVLGYREDALPRFALMPLDTTATAGAEAYSEFTPVEFEEELFTSGPGSNPEWDTPVLRFGYGSFVTPGRVYSMALDSGERTLLREQEVLGGYDPAGYVQRRDWATAEDGTQVPISLVMSVDTAGRIDAGEQVPTLLYGYGSYETSIDPAFSVARLSLLDRGMAYAVAHVRGGGEMGRLWYERGKTLTKRNTFTDFVDCARHLVDSGLTAPDRLIAEGGSAGGLLMGAVVNLAPELFAGIQAVVPFVDPLTSILMPELPLTVIEWDEWGDPLHSEEVYDYMASYAPYENIEAKGYPAILAVTSLNDTRVLYVEPAKWVAKLRAVSTSANSAEHPVLLRCEMSAGHGGVSGRYERWRQTAFEYAWTVRTAGAG